MSAIEVHNQNYLKLQSRVNELVSSANTQEDKISDICKKTNGDFIDLNDGLVLSTGIRYFENLTGVAVRTFTFTDVVGFEFIELLIITDIILTLTIPSSRLIGGSGSTTSVVLAVGNHRLRWDRADGDWWLNVD